MCGKLLNTTNWKMFLCLFLSLSFTLPQEDPFKVKPSVFNSQPPELHADPFHSEDPFKTDPFKGYHSPLFSLSPSFCQCSSFSFPHDMYYSLPWLSSIIHLFCSRSSSSPHFSHSMPLLTPPLLSFPLFFSLSWQQMSLFIWPGCWCITTVMPRQ